MPKTAPVKLSLKQALAELESMGTAQNRKVYSRHGVEGAMFGVSHANLGQLHKKIRVDQELAERLWASGNHDARVLATMICDPAACKAALLDRWARESTNHVLASATGEVAARCPTAWKRIDKWTGQKGEWVGAAGWAALAHVALQSEPDQDEKLEPFLNRIESEIHGAKNRTRYSMNSALIAIGARGGKLEKKAVAVAKRIGKVEVDHGETSCKTPDAVSYIPKAAAHRRRKSKRAS